ncbi:hypothetical protein [Spiroplasma tabanidicola]|uniref:DUF4064 domain-containing protein n=1 Tax=Spiroplasma tabanidicola TaxID=324079 RepID=A0A6I6CA93_9MOLU|nr:hypothetical protein [Spiroplasma tabanidicola]QGS51865.1 hypothetical protein STABA_v1c05020 [Spiroplasma tabanidicola]
MAGLGKSGALINLAAGIICFVFSFFYMLSEKLTALIMQQNIIESKIYKIVGGLLFVVSLVLIILSALTAGMNTNGLRISLGVISLLLIFISWLALFFPVILLLIGGILTLCGKDDENRYLNNYRDSSNFIGYQSVNINHNLNYQQGYETTPATVNGYGYNNYQNGYDYQNTNNYQNGYDYQNTYYYQNGNQYPNQYQNTKDDQYTYDYQNGYYIQNPNDNNSNNNNGY